MNIDKLIIVLGRIADILGVIASKLDSQSSGSTDTTETQTGEENAGNGEGGNSENDTTTEQGTTTEAVSYTHLTLPTIYSV